MSYLKVNKLNNITQRIATNKSPLWNVNEPCAVKTVIPIMVQMIAKLTAREGNFFNKAAENRH